MNESLQLVLGLATIPLLFGIITAFHMLFSVEVPEYHSVIQTSFGRFQKQRDQAGDFFSLARILPWVKLIKVSRQIRSQTFEQISIHDRNGTSLLVAIFIEYSVVDPKRLLFASENWKESMKSLSLHATTSAMGGLQLDAIIGNRSALEILIREEIKADFARWGLELHRILIQNVSLLPEVNRQVLQGVAAHLEKKKALIEEESRMEALSIDAETVREVATLKGQTMSQMALATSRAMETMKRNPKVFDAYQKLYKLSLYRPDQTVVFEGFPKNLSPTDAALLIGHGESRNESREESK